MTAAGILLYLFVLFAYLPGIVTLFVYRKVWDFPILTFTFLGMFLFNFLGSFNVFNLDIVYSVNFNRAAVLREYALLLCAQVLIYYTVIGYYILKRSAPVLTYKVTRFDNFYIGSGLTLILLLVACYFWETGTFLLFGSMNGDLTVDNAYSQRMKFVYGLKNWPIYNIGFTMLPIFISSYSLIRARVNNRNDFFFFFSMFVCFAASLSLGSKGGLFNFVLTLSVAFVVYLNASKQSVFKIFVNKNLIIFSILMFVLLVVGYFHATPEEITGIQFIERFWYRLMVTYTETIAAAISYAHEVGFLGGTVFPNARGLLPYEYSNLPLLLHEYIASAPGGVNTPFIAEAYLNAGWGSVVLITLLLFIVLIVIQEFMYLLKIGITSLAFSAFYSYIGIQLAILGMTSTLLTFMYPIAFIVLTIMTITAFFIHRLIINWSLEVSP